MKLLACVTLALCLSASVAQEQANSCTVSSGDNVWTYSDSAGVVFNCDITGVGGSDQALTIKSAGPVVLQSVGAGISNLEIQPLLGDPITVEIQGDIETSGVQTYTADLIFSSSEAQNMTAVTTITFEGSVNRPVGDLTITTPTLLALAEDSIISGGTLSIIASTLQLDTTLLESTAGDLVLEGGIQLKTSEPQTLSAPEGMVVIDGEISKSIDNGEVTITAGEGISAGRMNMESSLVVIGDLAAYNSVTADGDCSINGALTLHGASSITGGLAAQTIGSGSGVFTATSVEKTTTGTLNINGPLGIIVTGDLSSVGPITIADEATLGAASTSADLVLSAGGSVSGNLEGSSVYCQGDVEFTQPATVTAGTTLSFEQITAPGITMVAGSILLAAGIESSGDIVLHGSTTTVGGDLIAQGNIELGEGAVGITIMESSSVQRIEGMTVSMSEVSKGSGDLELVAEGLALEASVNVQAGSLTITAVTFTAMSNVLAGNDITLPACVLNLIGTVPQNVIAGGTLTSTLPIIKDTTGDMTMGGATVLLQNSVTVSGGSLVLQGAITAEERLVASGSLTFAGGVVKDTIAATGVTFSGDTVFEGPDATSVDAKSSTLTSHGTLTRTGGDLEMNGSTLNLGGDVEGDGMILFASTNAMLSGDVTAISLEAAGVQFTGAGLQTVTASSVDADSIQKNTDGDIEFHVSSAILIGAVTCQSGDVSFKMTEGGTDVECWIFGNIQVTAGALTMEYDCDLGTDAQTINVGSAQLMGVDNPEGDLTMISSGSISVDGSITFERGGALNVQADFMVSGDILNYGSAILSADFTLTGAGKQTVSSSELQVAGDLSKTTGDLDLDTSDSRILSGSVAVGGALVGVTSASTVLGGNVEAASISLGSGQITCNKSPKADIKTTSGSLSIGGDIISTETIVLTSATDITVSGDISAGALTVMSDLTLGGSILTTAEGGSADLRGSLTVSNVNGARVDSDRGALKIEGNVTVPQGDLEMGGATKIQLLGDVTLANGDLEVGDACHLWGDVTAKEIVFQFKLTLMGEGTTQTLAAAGGQLFLRGNAMTGGDDVSLLKTDGSVVIGVEGQSQDTEIQGDLVVFGGSLTIHSDITSLGDIYGIGITIDTATMGYDGNQIIDAQEGCLIANSIYKAAKDLYLGGMECITLGDGDIEAAGGVVNFFDEYEATGDVLVMDGGSIKQNQERPEGPTEPTPGPTMAPTMAPTATPATPAPTTKSPTVEGATPSPTKSPTVEGATPAPTVAGDPTDDPDGTGGGGSSTTVSAAESVRPVVATVFLAAAVWSALRQ